MKIKHIDTRIKLLPCRYCGRAPTMETVARYAENSIFVTKTIRCDCTKYNFVRQGAEFGCTEEVIFSEPVEKQWNDEQRYYEKILVERKAK